MTLYEEWISKAYNQKGESNEDVWKDYLPLEQKIYERLLTEQKPIKGTVKELAKEFNMSVEFVVGFIDGINEAIKEAVDIEAIDEDTKVNIDVEYENLYKKMVEYKAEHLYNLPEWKEVFTEQKMEQFYQEQKTSRTVVNPPKIGRNEPCPCGSGKKYKKCCGQN